MTRRVPLAQSLGWKRIVVLGTSGSGKTTLADQLAGCMGARHIELDALHWRPGWASGPSEEVRADLAAATARPAWVACGNYGMYRDITWAQADGAVWLDFPLSRVLAQVTWRSVQRASSNRLLWGSNVESWRQTFFSKDSIILWAYTSHKRRSHTGEALEKLGIPYVRIQTPAQRDALVRAWRQRG